MQVRAKAQIPLRRLTRNFPVTRVTDGEVSGFQTIATCRDGLKNSRDKSATSPFASWKRENRRRPRQDTGESA